MKYGSENHSFDIIDSFESTSVFAEGKEMFWIRSYMSNRSRWRDGNGLNLTNGGDSFLGLKHDKGRVSAFKGRRHTEESKRILSEKVKANPPRPMLGKHHSIESRFKMSKSKKGKVLLKPILQCTKDNIIIREFAGICIAAGELGMADSTIRNYLKNKRVHNMFNFKYKN